MQNLIFEVSNLFIKVFFFFFLNYFLRDQTFMPSIQKGGDNLGSDVLQFVECLRALLILNNRSIVHFCE